jgi:putative phosphoesterase
MRIAILSDIHANLPALEATLKSIDSQQPDAIYCLGDLVGYNVWPNEVIHEITKRGIATLAGNHDVKAQKVWRDGSDSSYSYAIIGTDEMEYLSTLPSHIRLEFRYNDRPLNILMVHGSPYSNKEYLLEDKDETEFLNIFSDTNTHVLLFGHSHKPYHRILVSGDDANPHYMHAINVGSVGKPKDGDPRACYAMLTLGQDSNIFEKESVGVKFIRVTYDIEKAAAGVEKSILPDTLADMLRKAY